MRLINLLAEEGIITELDVSSKTELLRRISDTLAKCYPSFNADEIFQVLMEREKLGSTGVGDGIAIPHGKLPEDRFSSEPLPILLFARSLRGIDFDAMDSKPVYLIFALIAPENYPGMHLKVLAKIARLLKNKEVQEKLLLAKTRKEILEIINQYDNGS
ncbi:MAG: PTS sugar transporter subunit IIA [Syntrophobacterales bacterium]|nr:PTS sugar transporter subunit IIA [Syntrophobacterales bacterium]